MELSSRVASTASVLATAPDAPDWLTPLERDRWSALRRADDRDAFAAAHVLVRQVAGEALGRDPRRLVVIQCCATCGGPHGRPRIDGESRLHVSLAHTRTHVAALAADEACGIDVEDLGRLRGRALPARALTAQERAWVSGADDPARRFGMIWVRKEALVKAGAMTIDELGEVTVVGGDGQWARCVRDTSVESLDAVGALVAATARRVAEPEARPPAA
ncbi:4'-phosphopantetheinyl transferase [Mumia flava]|uniref:4'-phosphopantetheinyl transferase n=1 Tax=Mumia flava TaxID=1348852 RepID=A0A2M9BK80_9ACTN|nr:4'-phosphopantetheinyl transferase superfamily protein [Mumia flava]PJJ58332.1 4'-phosphopantetheinyl transferase [Mumia flava]